MQNQVDQILNNRALQLAQKKEKESACDAECTTMLQINLSERSYCIEASFVKEILSIDALVPVPGSGRLVRGIVNVRGKIVAIIDLKILFGIESKYKKQNRVVVVKDELTAMEFGVLVDEISQTISVRDKDIKELPSNINGTARQNFSGISTEGFIIINTKQFINDVSLQVANAN